ncbi:Vacuolar assembly/sorting proteins VPS39/VAM6/VPS3 [Phaffia rhodozyma]|uniref:Vacuolar assembly/sorting proteins VPS39/VAM6/VPS3 n=1 Tax=Phaffia rhodozyma TaxID=264483 RepID=A0A0F7SEY3_PHARH|nr:Vacuolar assembly/sorting proteins VPS39/VAM6/VPS3 [Phaffia rhodozyma]
MPPFSAVPIIEGFKDKIDAVFAQGEKLFVAHGSGSLSVYEIDQQTDESEPKATLVETKKGLSRRAIDRLGFIREINSLVVLSDGVVSLYDPQSFALLSVLPQVRQAQTFAIHTSVSLPSSTPAGSTDPEESIPKLITTLLIGLKKRLLAFTWTDGTSSTPVPLSLALPHSPRSIAFVSPNRAILAYTLSDQCLIALDPLGVILGDLPLSSTDESRVGQSAQPTGADSKSVVSGLGSLSLGGMGGMGGYMGLGGNKARPELVRIEEGEVLVCREDVGAFFGQEGKISRDKDLLWTISPDELVYAKPFLLSLNPPPPTSLLTSASSNTTSSEPQQTTTLIQIRSSPTLTLTQTLSLPLASSTPSTAHYTLHHLTPSSSASSQTAPLKPPLFVVSTPVERAVLAAEGGSKIWCLTMKKMGDVLDDMLNEGLYEESLKILEGVDERSLHNKNSRRIRLETLCALETFRQNSSLPLSTPSPAQMAIETFLRLDINPAKVIALFPEIISGRLATPEDQWVELFGGPKTVTPVVAYLDSEAESVKIEHGSVLAGAVGGVESAGKKMLGALGIGGLKSTTMVAPGAGGGNSETQSLTGSVYSEPKMTIEDKRKEKEDAAKRKATYEALFHYLSDRRQKVLGALSSIPPSTLSPLETNLPPLSAVSKDELYTIPSTPVSSLTPEQVYRVAQLVDTALFKSYMVVRPSLVGSLCRLSNFCEVTEVEEQLKEKKKYSDLIDLYRTRKNHEKALHLLQELSEEEADLDDKLEPIVRYLLALGPKYMNLIFESSKWVFDKDFDHAMKIFKSDPDTVEQLPRRDVLQFLEKISPRAETTYLEYITQHLEENNNDFHDRLAELYLDEAKRASREPGKAGFEVAYERALQFLKTSERYRAGHILRLLPDDELFEARAVLLGRLGNHENALQIYVHRLEDYKKAEEYCVRTYLSNPSSPVFLVLLRIYLIPRAPTDKPLIPPALSLIAKHSTKLEPLEVIEILPPMLTMKDVHSFFLRTLRDSNAQRNEKLVLREVMKCREEQIDWRLMKLQDNRVRISDTRVCPQCKKRLGNSVIAVHTPLGEVTHLHCKDAFSLKLRNRVQESI